MTRIFLTDSLAAVAVHYKICWFIKDIWMKNIQWPTAARLFLKITDEDEAWLSHAKMTFEINSIYFINELCAVNYELWRCNSQKSSTVFHLHSFGLIFSATATRFRVYFPVLPWVAFALTRSLHPRLCPCRPYRAWKSAHLKTFESSVYELCIMHSALCIMN